VDYRIRPTLTNLAEAKAKQIATRAINEAIRSNISPNIRYQSLITLNFDKEGKVAFMQPNTSEINRISSEATLAVQNRLKDLPRQTIKIPVGQILGLRILAGYGPDLPVAVLPIGVVSSSIEDSFDVAGINQIRHRIFVVVNATVKMVIPFVNQQVRISSKVPLVEAIVMGGVPNIYVGGNGGVILPGNTEKK
jgi:sporulation protein YunB